MISTREFLTEAKEGFLAHDRSLFSARLSDFSDSGIFWFLIFRSPILVKYDTCDLTHILKVRNIPILKSCAEASVMNLKS